MVSVRRSERLYIYFVVVCLLHGIYDKIITSHRAWHFLHAKLKTQSSFNRLDDPLPPSKYHLSIAEMIPLPHPSHHHRTMRRDGFRG